MAKTREPKLSPGMGQCPVTQILVNVLQMGLKSHHCPEMER